MSPDCGHSDGRVSDNRSVRGHELGAARAAVKPVVVASRHHARRRSIKLGDDFADRALTEVPSIDEVSRRERKPSSVPPELDVFALSSLTVERDAREAAQVTRQLPVEPLQQVGLGTCRPKASAREHGIDGTVGSGGLHVEGIDSVASRSSAIRRSRLPRCRTRPRRVRSRASYEVPKKRSPASSRQFGACRAARKNPRPRRTPPDHPPQGK